MGSILQAALWALLCLAACTGGCRAKPTGKRKTVAQKLPKVKAYRVCHACAGTGKASGYTHQSTPCRVCNGTRRIK